MCQFVPCGWSRHIESLWFANVSNQLMWWAYVKAFLRSVLSRVCCCFMRIVRAPLQGLL